MGEFLVRRSADHPENIRPIITAPRVEIRQPHVEPQAVGDVGERAILRFARGQNSPAVSPRNDQAGFGVATVANRRRKADMAAALPVMRSNRVEGEVMENLWDWA